MGLSMSATLITTAQQVFIDITWPFYVLHPGHVKGIGGHSLHIRGVHYPSQQHRQIPVDTTVAGQSALQSVVLVTDSRKGLFSWHYRVDKWLCPLYPWLFLWLSTFQWYNVVSTSLGLVNIIASCIRSPAVEDQNLAVHSAAATDARWRLCLQNSTTTLCTIGPTMLRCRRSVVYDNTTATASRSGL